MSNQVCYRLSRRLPTFKVGHDLAGKELQVLGGDGVGEQQKEVVDTMIHVRLYLLHARLGGAGDGTLERLSMIRNSYVGVRGAGGYLPVKLGRIFGDDHPGVVGHFDFTRFAAQFQAILDQDIQLIK